MAKSQVFYRLVKAQPGHKFAGLYGVEKIYIRDNVVYKKELVHEWDNRIISEAVLSRLGGNAAYEAYIEDNTISDMTEDEYIAAVEARTAKELADLTQRKLNRELWGK